MEVKLIPSHPALTLKWSSQGDLQYTSLLSHTEQKIKANWPDHTEEQSSTLGADIKAPWPPSERKFSPTVVQSPLRQ